MVTCIAYKLCQFNATEQLSHLLDRTDQTDITNVYISVDSRAVSDMTVSTFYDAIGNLPEVRELVLASRYPLPACCKKHWPVIGSRPGLETMFDNMPESLPMLPFDVTSWSLAIPLLQYTASNLKLLDIAFVDGIYWREFRAFQTALVACKQLHTVRVRTANKRQWYSVQFNGLLESLCLLPQLRIVDLPPVPEGSSPGHDCPWSFLLRKPTVREFSFHYSFTDHIILDLLEDMCYNHNLTKLTLPSLLPEYSLTRGPVYNQRINSVIQRNHVLVELHFINMSTVYLRHCIPSAIALTRNNTLKILTFDTKNPENRNRPTHLSIETTKTLTDVIREHNDSLETLLFNGYCPCSDMEFYLKLNALKLPFLVSSRDETGLTDAQWNIVLVENSGDHRIVYCLLLYKPSLLQNVTASFRATKKAKLSNNA